MAARDTHPRASLEAVVESGDLGLAVFHPGGLESTRALAELCHVRSGGRLLDVASGTGESACYLAAEFGCQVSGIDHSAYMVDQAARKASERGLPADFQLGDALHLPFEAGTFDAVISECTTCALDKQRAIREMARVARSGGYVGIGDLYWKKGAPDALQARLAELEGERPESLAGWVGLFEDAGLLQVETRDVPGGFAQMSSEVRKRMGVRGQWRTLRNIVSRWGVRSLAPVFAAERIFRSKHLGYAIMAGRKE